MFQSHFEEIGGKLWIPLFHKNRHFPFSSHNFLRVFHSTGCNSIQSCHECICSNERTCSYAFFEEGQAACINSFGVSQKTLKPTKYIISSSNRSEQCDLCSSCLGTTLSSSTFQPHFEKRLFHDVTILFFVFLKLSTFVFVNFELYFINKIYAPILEAFIDRKIHEMLIHRRTPPLDRGQKRMFGN